MKKIIFTSIVIANIFLACSKKDRICNCSVTKTGTSTTTAVLSFSLPLIGNVPLIDTSFVTSVSQVNTYDKTLTKVTKKQAKNNCIGYKEPYNDVILNSAPPLMLSTTEVGTRTYDCTLK